MARPLMIFDLDGTLTNLLIDFAEIRKKLKKLFDEKNDLSPLLSTIEILTANNPDLKTKAYQIIEEEELKAVEKMRKDEEVKKTLEKLSKLGYRFALVTMQSRKVAEKALKKLEIRHFFETIFTRQYSIDRKEQIFKIIQDFEANPKQTIVIGDRLEDVKSGKELGCLTIGKSNKMKRRRLLKSSKPFRVISKIPHLIDVVAELTKDTQTKNETSDNFS